MANIARYAPFSDVMDEMFKNFMSKPMRFLEEETGMQVRTEITENEKAYFIKAEIPGVKKEDIHVTVEGNRVSISAEVKKESEEKEGSRTIRSERYYGKVYRAITLDSDVNRETAEAKYVDGILTLTLPKKSDGTARQMVIR